MTVQDGFIEIHRKLFNIEEQLKVRKMRLDTKTAAYLVKLINEYITKIESEMDFESKIDINKPPACGNCSRRSWYQKGYQHGYEDGKKGLNMFL